MPEREKVIVVVGSINMDLVSRVPSFPRAGETVCGSSFSSQPGGKGANQAVGVARLGHAVQMIGMVGNDHMGVELRKSLERENVDVTHVGVVEVATGTATILVDTYGENCIVVVPGANATVTPDLIREKEQVIASACLVMTQLEIPSETVELLAELCEVHGVPLILDPAPAKVVSSLLLTRVAWFTPNETEATIYAPDAADLEECVSELSRLGPTNVILKRGAAGSALRLGDEATQLIPAPTVDVVDTTAAGDSFNAAFAVGISEGRSPEECARFASIAAAICVTRTGAQSSLAFREEIDEAIGEVTFEHPEGSPNAKSFS